MADVRHLKKEHELLDGVPEGAPVTIRKKKGNPNIIVKAGEYEIEMSVEEAQEHISAKGEAWVPIMFRLSADHFRKYDDDTLHWAYKLALRNHERFLRDASVYDSMPHGNESYENAAYYAERYKEMAQTIKGVIDERT